MSVFTARRYNRHEVRKRQVQVASDTTVSHPSYFTGQKFPGGLGGMIDSIVGLDYWELRRRSSVLFKTNMYAKGIVRRLITNVINTGLEPESHPFERILGLPEDSLADWSEATEELFSSWSSEPMLCDFKGERTFGKLQRQAMLEAYVSGDVLIVLRQNEATKLPVVQLIQGNRVKNPMSFDVSKNIVDGVEMDKDGRHVAYHIEVDTGVLAEVRSERIPAFGTATGRKQAWLFYGIEKREDGVRGEPLLSIAMQGISEIDKYRDAAQRKASINASMVGFVKRGDALPSLSMSRASLRTKTETANDAGTAKPISVSEVIPGIWMDRLAPGEEPSSFATSGSDVSFGPFETAIVYGIAWALEIPPEILTLSFSHNYSASQAATSEFRIFLEKARADVAEGLLQGIYNDWFISSVLLNRISATGFLEARRSGRVDVVSAWTRCDWTGAIKPSIDPVKQANGYKILVDNGWITNDRAAREINGSKFSRNVRRLRKELEMKKDAGLVVEEQPMTPQGEFAQQAASALERIEDALADRAN